MKKSLFICLLLSKFSFSQNVGIGTSAPASKLHVSATTSNIATFTGGSPMYITLAEGTFNRGYIGSFAGNDEDVDFGTYNSNPGKVHLTTGNIPRLSVLSNGNVGIGTVNPEQLFSVAAGMVIDQNNNNTGTVANSLHFGSASGEAIGSKRTAGSNQYGLDFYTQSQQRMTITNGGNIGIGLVNPASRLELRGALGFSSTTKKWEMNYDSTAGYFYIDEFGSGRRFFIENGGNIGIGTANPNAKLDVNGDINVANKILLNNNAGSPGQALISGGPSGVASWESIAYGNSDRFLFAASGNLVNGLNFGDTLKFNTNYALSGAISYNNSTGIFTVNKSGLYRFEGSFNCAGIWTNPQNGLALLFMLTSAGTITLGYEIIPVYGNAPNYQGLKLIQPAITLYFSAGSNFFFLAVVEGSGTINQAGVIGGSPLSINLIAE